MESITFGPLASWVSVIIAAFGLGSVIYQVRRQRQLNSANLLVTLESKYGEAQMIRWRREFAILVRDNRLSDVNAITGYQPVIAFFDMIALLVQQGILEMTLVWHRFGWRALRCWLAIATNQNPNDTDLPATNSLLDRMRRAEKEPRIYEPFEWLGEQLIEMHIAYNKLGPHLSQEMLTEMIDQYFKQESALELPAGHTNSSL